MTIKFKKRVLAIDGGGIRGIIPAMVLNYIEQRTSRRICDMFDLISGTSTGGILALGLTKRNSDSELSNEPEYTAAELVNFYQKHGKTIFDEYIPTPIDEPFQPKFDPRGRKKVLTELLREAKINDALKEIFIPSYDIELRIPVFFTSNHAAEQPDSPDSRKICRGFSMVDTAMATSAAPTYFEPYKVDTVQRTEEGYYALIDGGVFANNPSYLAMIEAMISYKRECQEELLRTDTLLVSLGTGALTRKYKLNKARKWGKIDWIMPLINIVMDGQSEAVAFQLNQLMITEGQNRNYYRFQVPLSSDDSHDEMDNASQDNIQYLEKLGKKLIEQRKDQLNELCSVLVAQ